jgi:tyrosine-specific transport protein
MRKDKGFLGAAFTLSGSIVGAGILGLPYVFSQSGFIIGLFWILFFGVILTYTYLCLGEITLRVKGKHQLPGLAEKYLGKKGKYLMLFAMMYGIYISLLAYLIAEGQSISRLITGGSEYALFGTLIFWGGTTYLLQGGIQRLKKIETYGVLAIIIIIVGIFIYFIPSIEISNLTYTNNHKILVPLGVALYALLGFASIPELREEMRGNEKNFKKAIIAGVVIPITLYTLFTASIVGRLGTGVSEIATLSFGPIMIILGIFTIFTSYFVLSFAIRDICLYDIKMKKQWALFWSVGFPLLLYLIFTSLNWTNFISIIGIGGVISGGLTGILIFIMNYKSKQKKGKKPLFVIPINKFIIGILSIIFIVGASIQIYTTIS